MSKKTVGTVGDQKNTNYALRADMTKEEFIKEVLSGISEAPQYFSKNAILNQCGYSELDEVLENGNKPLSVSEFESLISDSNNLVLDVRTQKEFIENHIPGSLFIGLNGGFAPWVGALINNIKQSILLVVPEGKSKEAITRLARVGYDHTIGYLEGGMQAWVAAGKAIDQLTSISSIEFENHTKKEVLSILDVRKKAEYDTMHLKLDGLQHLSLGQINLKLDKIDTQKTY